MFCHSQVHPEGKFVVDVDKNIDINDVSIIDVLCLSELLNTVAVFTVTKQINKYKPKIFYYTLSPLISAPGDSKLPCGSA